MPKKSKKKNEKPKKQSKKKTSSSQKKINWLSKITSQDRKFKWDAWQQKVLEHEGNITIRSGRQVGKSEVISAKAAIFALENPGRTVMIIAASQRQSSLLFEKTRAYLDQFNEYAEKPTLTKIKLKNDAIIYSLPAGRTGYFIRGYTIDLLIADEAAYIPEEVWKAVIPTIAVSRKVHGMGYIITISTPFGKGGYFYDTFTDADFKQFHVSSEDCRRIDPDHLRKERERLSKVEYAQEYLGEFIDDYRQFFPTALIKKQMTFMEFPNEKLKKNPAVDRYYLGVDIARYGGDENAFVIAMVRKNKIRVVKCSVTSRVSTTDTIGRIRRLHEHWKFSKIFIDDAGVGGAVLDVLQETIGARTVLGLNNASKRYRAHDEVHRDKKFQKFNDYVPKGILKEDLYSNVLVLLEQGRLELISDLKLLRSMKSIVFEYGKENNRVKLFGNYSHLTEALVRACWCDKEKGFKVYIN